MSTAISLKDRHTDATQKLILSTAIDLLEGGSVGDVTVRGVAKAAGMSERTIFRYFATREDFLDAVAAEAASRLEPPPPPAGVAELISFPTPLYNSFEERSRLVSGILHTDLFSRVRTTAASDRWSAVANLIDLHASSAPKKDRRVASANINYFLSATTWHYYRFRFELSQSDTIACARSAIAAIVDSLGVHR